MIFVTGPLYAGKEETICRSLGWSHEDFLQNDCIRDVQNLAADCNDLETLADTLASRWVVIATEMGGGVVPVDARQRHAREQAGRLSCLLAARADTVVRVCCGIPQVLKGMLPRDTRADDGVRQEHSILRQMLREEPGAASPGREK